MHLPLLQPIHSLGDQSPGPVAPWELQFPGSVMQFLCLLHNRRPKDPLWSSAEFLHTLAGVVFPVDVTEVSLKQFFIFLDGQGFDSQPQGTGLDS